MAYRINERQVIDDNVFKYEDRIKSPTVRYQDTTPVYVNYWHVIADETTADAGFLDMYSRIGFRSPCRYNKIEGFPIYGLDTVILQINDTEEGLDSEYEGEAYVLPNTIKPLTDDYFMIPTLKDAFLFRVTGIQYDAAMPDNYYKFTYKLEYIDEDEVEKLTKQEKDQFTCILENIGTERNCIVENGLLTNIESVEKMYDEIVRTYISIFYNDRYNVLLAPFLIDKYLYDPFMTDFVNKHGLINNKMNISTIILTNQCEDKLHRIKYEKSVYRFIENPDVDRIEPFFFVHLPGVTYHESSFFRWKDRHVECVDIIEHLPDEPMYIFSKEFIANVQLNGEMDSPTSTLIKKFIRKEELHVTDIPSDLLDEVLRFNDSLEIFFITPIVLYIIREVISHDLYIDKSPDKINN